MWKLFTGDVEGLEGQVAPEILLAAAMARELMAEVALDVYEASSEHFAEQMSRLYGLALFELALTAATAGFGQAAKSARIARLLQKLDNIPGLTPPMRAKIAKALETLANALNPPLRPGEVRHYSALGGAVPSVRGGEFQSWFNKLTPDELDKIWSDPSLRKQIEQRLRSPGGFHEWLPVSRAPIFKKWGISADQIHQLRTATKDVIFKAGLHGGDFSGTAHQQLFKLIDESSDFADYVRKLRKWADENLVGGAGALPEGLRP